MSGVVGADLEQLVGHALDEHARREASLLEARRGVEARGQHRVGLRDPPRLEQKVAELDLDARALARVGDPELERAREPRGRLVEAAAAIAASRGAEVVVDRALDAGDRGGEREVVGELGQDAGRIGRVDALERLADAEVKLGSADPDDPVVDGAAHELVREAAGRRRLRQLLDDPGPDASSTAAASASRSSPAASASTRSSNRGPGDGRELDGRGRLGSQPREALPHDVADPLGAAQLGERPRNCDAGVRHLDRAALAQVAPELAEQERRAAGELAERRGELRVASASVEARTNAPTSSALRLPSASRVTPSRRERSASVSESAGPISSSRSR